MPITHAKTSAIEDGDDDTLIQPSDWNAEHVGGLDNPMTTAGDIIYGGASGTPTRLAAGTEGQVLKMGATNPEWAAAAAAGVVEGDFTDYSEISTIVGWSSFTTKKIFYKKIGALVFCIFQLGGVSNSPTTTFTLPDNVATGLNIRSVNVQSKDNGTTLGAPGIALMTAGSNVVTIGKNPLNDTFTDSGDKTVQGQFFYVAA